MTLTEQNVQEFLVPDETAAELVLRLRQEQLPTGLDFLDAQLGSALRPGCLLEVAGPAGCGKTTMLLRMAMRCVLPGSASVLAGSLPGSAGGSSGALQAPWGGGPPEEGAAAQAPRHSVLIVDVDGKSDSLLLHKVLESEMRRQYPQLHARLLDAQALLASQPAGAGGSAGASLSAFTPRSLSEAQGVVEAWGAVQRDCLQRLHVTAAHSSLQLLAALLAAEGGVLLKCKEEGAPCRLLLLDDVGGLSHSDKAQRACPYAPRPNSTPPAPHARRSPPPATPPGSPGKPQPTGGAGALPFTSSAAAQSQFAATRYVVAPPPPLGAAKGAGALAAALQRLAQRHRLCAVASRHASVALLDTDDRGPSRLASKDYMPQVWQQAVTHRLLLGPPAVIYPNVRGGATPVTMVPAQLLQQQHPGVSQELQHASWLMRLYLDEHDVSGSLQPAPRSLAGGGGTTGTGGGGSAGGGDAVLHAWQAH